MSTQQNTELCQWDNPSCANPAARHVNWLLKIGGRRDKHLCDLHSAELHERDCDARDGAISLCDTRCPVIRSKQQ